MRLGPDTGFDDPTGWEGVRIFDVSDATDGVHNPVTGRGFQVFEAAIDVDEDPLDHLNPQTQG